VKKTKKCGECKKEFDLPPGGKYQHYHSYKYCSNECRYAVRKRKNIAMLEKQKIRANERRIKFKHLKGLLKRKCKNCKNEYEVYAAQLIARGTGYCSVSCKNKHKLKKTSVASHKKFVWELFSKYIRLRDAIKTTGTSTHAKCITCESIHKITEIDAGHFYSRTNTAILFDEQNVHAQCKKCNMPPNHGEQYTYSLKIVDMYGEENLRRLTNLRGQIKRFRRDELMQLREEYRNNIRKILNSGFECPWIGFQ